LATTSLQTTQRSPRGGSGAMTRLWMLLAGLLLMLGSFRLAVSGGGPAAVGGFLAIVAGLLVLRRPAIGILIYLTTFLFTYPAFLRGVGNFTINNMLGLVLLPLMLYGLLREGNLWLVRFRPVALLAAVVALMIGSSVFYTPSTDYGVAADAQKIETSRRTQGPALIATRDAGAKFLTRFAFLLFFVFFIRSPRDVKLVIGVIVACLLLTYFSVGTAAGPAGWGTGRLRVMGQVGAAVYAGRNPNKLAYFALFGLTLLWYGRRAIRNPLLYPFWFVGTAITFVMIPMTGSRSGLLNLLLFITIVTFEGKFNYRKVLGLALVTFFVTVQFGYDVSVVDKLFPEEIAARLTRFDVRREALEEGLAAQGSAEGRLRTAQATLRVWLSHPLLGVGIGNYETERAATDPYGTIGPPHDSYIWALAEGGLVVFSLFAAFFFYVFRELRRIEWEYQARYGPVGLGWLVQAMRTALIGFLFFSFFADMWHHVLFYIIMGLALALIRLHQVYAETGRVPEAFVVGRPMQPVEP